MLTTRCQRAPVVRQCSACEAVRVCSPAPSRSNERRLIGHLSIKEAQAERLQVGALDHDRRALRISVEHAAVVSGGWGKFRMKFSILFLFLTKDAQDSC